MRYPISGVNVTMANNMPVVLDGTAYSDQPVAATAMCAGVYAMGRAVTSGRTFWLRGINFSNASANAVFNLFDGTEGNTASTSTRRMGLTTASGGLVLASGGSNRTNTAFTFAAPGIKFTTGCCVAREATAQGAATTLWGPGTISAYGYEEA